MLARTFHRPMIPLLCSLFRISCVFFKSFVLSSYLDHPTGVWLEKFWTGQCSLGRWNSLGVREKGNRLYKRSRRKHGVERSNAFSVGVTTARNGDKWDNFMVRGGILITGQNKIPSRVEARPKRINANRGYVTKNPGRLRRRPGFFVWIHLDAPITKPPVLLQAAAAFASNLLKGTIPLDWIPSPRRFPHL